MYTSVVNQLNRAYKGSIEERNLNPTQDWKARVRKEFLDRLRAEKKTRLLEVGAGIGVHGLFFKQAGMDVLCTDASPDMVAACTAKGLNAEQADFLSLKQGKFDAVFSMNCFLHVPPENLDQVLESMHESLTPGGLLYWGQYGGETYAGELDNDHYTPKRYFSLLNDDQLLAHGRRIFRLVAFETVPLKDPREHFQSSIWRADSEHG